MHHWTSVLKYFHIQSFPEQKRKLMCFWLFFHFNTKPKAKTQDFFRTEFSSDSEYDQDQHLPRKNNFFCTALRVFSDKNFYVFYKSREKDLNMQFSWRYTICESNCTLTTALTRTKASSTSITKLRPSMPPSSPCQKKTEKCIHWEQVMHCIPKRVHQWTNYSGLKRRKQHTAVGLFSLVPECK